MYIGYVSLGSELAKVATLKNRFACPYILSIRTT